MSLSPSRALVLALAFLAVACSSARVRTEVPLLELQARAARDSADAVAQYNHAIGLWSEGRFDEARAALERSVRIDPRFAEGYLALAYLPYAERPELWQERFEDRVPPEWADAVLHADEQYRRALMINPLVNMRILGAVTPPSRFAYLGGALERAYLAWFGGFEDYREGDYQAAFGRYDRLIAELEVQWRRDARQHMPDAILLYRGLAAAHLGRWDVAVGDVRIVYDRYAAAEQDEDELVHIPLETNHYRYVLAALLEGAGQLSEAEAQLRDVATEDLGMYMAHVRLANIAERRGDMAMALQERQLAVDANPGDPTVHLEQGLTYANAGMLAQSLAALRTAVELNPLDAQAHYFLGLVSAMTGEREAAATALERFLALAPERMAAERTEAENRLASLR